MRRLLVVLVAALGLVLANEYPPGLFPAIEYRCVSNRGFLDTGTTRIGNITFVSVCDNLDIRIMLNDPAKLQLYYVYNITVYYHEAWVTASTDVTTIVNWITKKFILANNISRKVRIDSVEYQFGVKTSKVNSFGYLITMYKTDSGILILATYVNNPWWR
jgi:hypothetical protein